MYRVNRLVETSTGWVEFELTDHGRLLGVNVVVTAFNADGWQSERGIGPPGAVPRTPG